MRTEDKEFSDLVKQKYQHGFVTDIEQELVPPGLDEDVVRLISKKSNVLIWYTISRKLYDIINIDYSSIITDIYWNRWPYSNNDGFS